MPHKPLFAELSAQLRSRIAQAYAVGDRFPGEVELARNFDVSLVTIRQALTALVQEGLLERQQGRGTFVRQLPSPPVLGIYIECNIYSPKISRWHCHLVGSVRKRLDELGLPCRVYVGRREPANASLPQTPAMSCPEFVADIRRGELAGVISVSTNPHPDWVDPLSERDLPFVGTAAPTPMRVNSNMLDVFRGAIDELVRQGRRNFAMLYWDDPQGFAAQHLVRAFHEQLQSHRLPIDPQWIRGDLYPATPGSGWEEFREIWTSSRIKPDALFITDDCLLPDVATVVRELRIRVPEQLMLVGAVSSDVLLPDNLPIARMETDAFAYATQLVQLMQEALAGNRTPRQREVAVQWRPLRHQADRPRASTLNRIEQASQ